MLRLSKKLNHPLMQEDSNRSYTCLWPNDLEGWLFPCRPTPRKHPYLQEHRGKCPLLIKVPNVSLYVKAILSDEYSYDGPLLGSFT
jgi:hypothetical protein